MTATILVTMSVDSSTHEWQKACAEWACVLSIIAGLLPPVPVFASQRTADSLSGYWKFDETSGTSAADSSGEVNTGTNSGATISTDVPTTTYTNTRSLQFDGINDSVSITSASSLNIGTNNFTVMAWVKGSAMADSDIIFAKSNGGGASTSYGYLFGVFGGLKPRVYWATSATALSSVESDVAISNGSWTHIAIVVDRSTSANSKAYINGTAVSTSVNNLSTNTGSITNSVNFLFGSESDGSFNWDGYIDDARLYKRAMSNREIAEIAAGNHPTAYWRGKSGTGFERRQNWSGSYIPDPYSRIIVRAATGSLTLTGAIKAAALTINTGALMSLNGTGFTMNDSGTFTNYGTLALKNSETLTNLTVPSNKGTIMINGTGSTTGFKTGNSYHNLTINDGLRGYWKFDEPIANSVLDSSGYGNSGSLVNGPTVSTDGAPLKFRNNQSVSFDGTNDYILVGTPASLDLQQVTVSGWVKQNGTLNDWEDWVSHGNGGYFMAVRSTGRIQWGQQGNGSNQVRVVRTAVLNGAWHHIAGTYDGTTLHLYFNGDWIGSTTSSFSFTNSNPLWIGSDVGNAEYFGGKIDDVRIYGRALRPGEIATLAAGNQPSLQQGTITLDAALDVNNHFTLNGGTLDVSSSNYTVNVGGSWLNNGGKFTARKGTVTFDGTSAGLELLTGGQRFNAVTFNGAGGTWNTRDRLTASGTLTLSAGTLDASGSYLIRAGTVTQTSGTFTPRSGTLVLTSAVDSTHTITSTLNALHIEDPTENGLVGYWKFDEGTNTGAILDSSGNNNTGVRTGTGLAWTGATLPSAIGFDNPFAMNFNGFNDQITVSDSSSLDLSSAATFSAWVKWGEAIGTDDDSFIDKTQSGDSPNYRLYLPNSGGNAGKFGFYNGSNAEVSTSTISRGVWHHLAITIAGTTASYYIDGVLDVTRTIGLGSVNNGPLLIGTDPQAAQRHFNGQLDDVRIYNRALSTNEVVNLYRGRYAAGHSSTSTFTLGSNLDAYSLDIFSGNLNTASSEVDLSYPMSLLRGDGILTLGSADTTLAGLILSGSTVTGGSGDLHSSWDIRINTGSLIAPTGTIFLNGNWLKYGGSVDPNNGTVVLESTNPTVEGTTTFYNLTKNTAGSVNFGTGDTFSINGTLTLQGSAGNLLTLQSRTAGYTWTINPSGTRSISYVAVRDSINSNALAIDCGSTCTDNGNNTNWTFTTTVSSSSSSSAQVTGGGGGKRGRGSVLNSALRAHATIQEQYRRAIVIDDARDDRPSTIRKPGAQPTDELPQRVGTYGIARERNRLVLDTADVRLIYKDVIADSWYAPYVANVIQENIARGYKDANGKLTGEFGVANPVTYAEILKMALEAAKKSNTKAAPPRNQSAKDSWASSYVGIAEQMQLKVFGSELNVHSSATRAEVVQTILEVFNIPIGKSLSTFDDVPADHRYNGAIATAMFYGLIEGDTDADGNTLNTFRPDEKINRAEVAKIIALAKELLKQ